MDEGRRGLVSDDVGDVGSEGSLSRENPRIPFSPDSPTGGGTSRGFYV